MNLRPHQQRAYDKMESVDKGQIIIPTGGGKTFIMIADCKRHIAQATSPRTIVVVAPRILLSNQLHAEFSEHVLNAKVLHVHSGEVKEDSTTKPHQILGWSNKYIDEHQMLFTTYHSLHRIVSSGIDIDTIYYDEAHNGTGRSFNEAIVDIEDQSDRHFFFTATPKHDKGSARRGMNNTSIYGGVLESTPAPELIANGSIVPPKVNTHECDIIRTKQNAPMIDAMNIMGILDSLDEDQAQKVLVAAPNTKVLWNMLSQTDIIDQCKDLGYDILHITSKHGCYFNKKKINRQMFFKVLNALGKMPERKFLVFHYSILSEGISVAGLSHCILLRNLPIVEMAQTIGRVIRTHPDDRKLIEKGELSTSCYANWVKPCGFVTVPTTSGYGAGTRTQRRLEGIIDLIFVKGIPAIANVYS